MIGLLVFRLGSQLCALPLEHAVEVLRPLPLSPFPGAADFVSGVAVVRGEPVPVVNLARLVVGQDQRVERWISARAGDRRVALAVGPVEGIRFVEGAAFSHLPPLLKVDQVSAVGTLDAQLAVVLQAAQALPDSVWETVA